MLMFLICICIFIPVFEFVFVFVFVFVGSDCLSQSLSADCSETSTSCKESHKPSFQGPIKLVMTRLMMMVLVVVVHPTVKIIDKVIVYNDFTMIIVRITMTMI